MNADDYARRRLFTAANGRPATAQEKEAIGSITEAARGFMSIVAATAPNGDDKRLALQLIEDALMRANRSFFNPESTPLL